MSGRAFENYCPILNLTINNGLETIFYINASPYPIQIFNKNFDLNFEKFGLSVNALQFEKNSLNKYTEDNPLTIIIIYED